jgi:hypothetical protein
LLWCLVPLCSVISPIHRDCPHSKGSSTFTPFLPNFLAPIGLHLSLDYYVLIYISLSISYSELGHVAVLG